MAAAKTKTGTSKTASSKTAGKKTAAKAKTTNRSTAKSKTQTGKSSSKKKTIPVPEPKTPVYNFSLLKEILVIAAFGFSIVLFASCFQKKGSTLYWLQDAVFWLFGDASYLIPFLFFFAICCLVANYGKRTLGFKMVSFLLFLIASCGIAELITFHGGIIGNGAVNLLKPLLGAVGAYIVMVVLALVGVVMLTGHSLVRDIRNNSRRVCESLREKSEDIHEEHQVRAGAKRLERERQNAIRRQERRQRIEELEEECQNAVTARKQYEQEEREKRVKRIREKMVIRGIGDTIVEPDELPDFSEEDEPTARYSEMRPAARYSEMKPADREEYPWEPEPDFQIREEDIVHHAVSAQEQTGHNQDRMENGRWDEMDEEDPDEFRVHLPEPQIFLTEEDAIKDESPMYPEEPQEPEMNVQMMWDSAERRERGKSSFETSSIETDVLKTDAEKETQQEKAEWTFREEADPEPTTPNLYEQELPPDPVADPLMESRAGTPIRKKDTYSNTAKSETLEENRVKTVRTATGKVITVELDGLPGERKLPADVKKREVEEKFESSIVPEEYIEPKEYVFPSLQMLKKGSGSGVSREETSRRLKETAVKLQQTLQNFGVGVTVTNISCGPSVTRYELQPEQGVKVSRIVSLTDDIKLNLAAEDIRMEAPIPGKAAIGIEVPNKEKQSVMLRDLLESEEFKKHPSKVVFAAGKDIAGSVILADIAKMPHLLIAGATGSGKSVCINTIIMSILYKAKPSEVKLIMIDPKIVELSVYNGIPHLMIPVVTDPKKAAAALNWAVTEMTDRYQKFAELKVRDMKSYNEKVEEVLKECPDAKDAPKKMPQIVIIVDELADLMMVASGDVEDAICRLAQMARAAGIHLVIATQRPSVNVITGLIKANVPSRIAFSVSSGTDSRTIIDMNGAEKLLGKGDMLFYPSGYPKPLRVQGCFVSESEVSEVVKFLTEQKNVIGGEQNQNISLDTAGSSSSGESRQEGSDRDEYFEKAGRFIIEKEKASIGMLQRMFKIGFNRAARIMDQLAEAGVVSEEEGTKPRRVLMTMEEFDQL
ncbi:MAG: DNA translocase FtsK 4TM domain-containing protein [Lachnospiraceae bacterium]|nr:DNA translocase FtsK 4TM domain-containing protein [Lachnospiraceae bacterium]